MFSTIKAMKKQLIIFFLIVPSVWDAGTMLEYDLDFFPMIEAVRGFFGHNFFMDILALSMAHLEAKERLHLQEHCLFFPLLEEQLQ